MANKPNNIFKLKSVDGKLTVTKSSNTVGTTNQNKLNVTQTLNGNNCYSIQSNAYKQFDEHFSRFQNELLMLNLTQKNEDKFYSLCENLVSNLEVLCTSSLPSSNQTEKSNMGKKFKYVIEKLRANNSHQKRLKIIQQMPTYVKPVENAIGIKYKSVINPVVGVPNHTHVQTTYHYVSIIETIRALFLKQDFLNTYFDFNQNSTHQCTPGTYEYFCCGSTSKNHPIYHDKSTIHIQIGIDDFEPCCALKSKSGKHKQCAIYFEIRNLPEHVRSKLNSIFIIAMVPVEELKHNNEAMDEVSRKIVNELAILECKGIEIENKIIKAGLINISGDNLGLNGFLGFVECFRAQYFCRICECNQTECQSLVREVPEKIRDRSTYLELLEKVDEKKQKFIDSKGFKKYCLFNELKTFSIFENFSIDVMHDMNEGVIGFFIKQFLTYVMKNNHATAPKVQRMIRDYFYGPLWLKYKPSLVNIDRNNTNKIKLNQNAMQMYCLMLHLPFIFVEFKMEMKNMWEAMENLLQIMQIVYSRSISDSDISRLKICIEKHLWFIVDDLKLNLKPKHHFLTHYPKLIKCNGPVIHAWMMRYESKHKFSTEISKRSNNFINLSKTLVTRHQMYLYASLKSYEIEMTPSKTLYDVTKSINYNTYSHHLLKFIVDGNLLAFDFLMYESIQFRPGLFVINGENVFEIIHILQNNSDFFLLCACYSIVEFNSSFNSIEIKLIQNLHEVIDLKTIKNKKTHDKKTVNNKFYIIADTLEVCKNFE